MPMVAISSRKSVPPLATSKRPFLEAMAEVNAPLTWPKSVDSSSSEGMAPVLMGTKGLSLRGELAWMALAMSSLPVPLSPWMRTVERLGATWATRSKTFSMDLALAHDVGEVVALLEGALELQVLFFGAMAGDGGADVGQQLLVVPGLLDEVFRAGADGFDDVVHGAVGGDHDDRQLRLAFLDLGQQLQAALAGQGQVEQHQVEVFLLQNAQALFAVGGHS